MLKWIEMLLKTLIAILIGVSPILINAQDVDKEYLLGKISQQENSLFVQLSDQHTSGAARGQYLRRET